MNKSEKKQVFTEIYNANIHKIQRLCHSLLNDKNAIEDLFHEIMIRIWNNLENFRHESKITTWIYKIAINTILSHNQIKFPRKANVKDLNLAQEPEDTLHQKEEEENRYIQLYQAISQLPEQDRMVIIMLLDGFTYEEISETVGISINYVGVKINRIKSQLKKKLN
jgi:RNA polymerase sigma-70 factor (ECF subfamily)